MLEAAKLYQKVLMMKLIRTLGARQLLQYYHQMIFLSLNLGFRKQKKEARDRASFL